MKILFLSLFTLLISLTSSAQQKSIEVVYTKAYKHIKDTSDISPQPLENLNYRLSCNPYTSRFERIPSLFVSDERFIYLGGGKGIYYKSTKEKIKLVQAGFSDSTFLIKENYNKYKWELKEDEKKTILGYECYKAVGSYQEYSYVFKEVKTIRVTVWYAPGVSYPFGPAGYDGLPGLVLEVSRGSFYFIATRIRFSDTEKKIIPPDKGKKVSRKEFNKAIYEIFLKRTAKE